MKNEKLKPCPYCGGRKIGLSVKTTGRFSRRYYFSMYCEECHCYGARVLTEDIENANHLDRKKIESSEKYKALAIEAWNNRAQEGDNCKENEE